MSPSPSMAKLSASRPFSSRSWGNTTAGRGRGETGRIRGNSGPQAASLPPSLTHSCASGVQEMTGRSEDERAALPGRRTLGSPSQRVHSHPCFSFRVTMGPSQGSARNLGPPSIFQGHLTLFPETMPVRSWSLGISGDSGSSWAETPR